MTIDQTNDLEAIRQLKARYFRLMDTQQWEAWADCFTADVSAFYEGVPRANSDLQVDVGLEGRSKLVNGVSTLMTGAKSIHQGFMEIPGQSRENVVAPPPARVPLFRDQGNDANIRH